MDNSGFNIVISDEDDERMVGFRLSFTNGYTVSVILVKIQNLILFVLLKREKQLNFYVKQLKLLF